MLDEATEKEDTVPQSIQKHRRQTPQTLLTGDSVTQCLTCRLSHIWGNWSWTPQISIKIHAALCEPTRAVNTMTKATWGGKSLFDLCCHIIAHDWKKSGRSANLAGSWRQELLQRPWRGAACWISPHGLLSLFSYRIQDYQCKDVTT